jgi:hypothetical protein
VHERAAIGARQGVQGDLAPPAGAEDGRDRAHARIGDAGRDAAGRVARAPQVERDGAGERPLVDAALHAELAGDLRKLNADAGHPLEPVGLERRGAELQLDERLRAPRPPAGAAGLERHRPHDPRRRRERLLGCGDEPPAGVEQADQEGLLLDGCLGQEEAHATGMTAAVCGARRRGRRDALPVREPQVDRRDIGRDRPEEHGRVAGARGRQVRMAHRSRRRRTAPARLGIALQPEAQPPAAVERDQLGARRQRPGDRHGPLRTRRPGAREHRREHGKRKDP